MDLIIGTLEQGLIYAILALGVYITYKILDFPDLTADGSFPLGAAITATMISNGGNPILAMGEMCIRDRCIPWSSWPPFAGG